MVFNSLSDMLSKETKIPIVLKSVSNIKDVRTIHQEIAKELEFVVFRREYLELVRQRLKELVT